MVHRPPDSRLLTNLSTHEKDYAKQLQTLLDQSHGSLASLSAYASASAPPLSQVILSVAGSLAGADDALRRYGRAFDEWREHLKSIKTLEDEVGYMIRDREIYVTRLIKLSKAQKPSRDSSLLPTSTFHSSSSSASIKSDFSGSITSSSKLSAAQAELQACEAQLAVKERELEEKVANGIKLGLKIRCTAMVECGWVWGEMGKEALRALDGLDDLKPQEGISQSSKPLPDSQRQSSDLSSLAPSQSASQTVALSSEHQTSSNFGSSYTTPPQSSNHHRSSSVPSKLEIPPAHSISDFALPTAKQMPPPAKRHVLSRRITEESVLHDSPNEAGGSSSDEEVGAVEVVENVRFATAAANGSKHSIGNGAGASPSRNRFSIRPGSKSDVGPSRPAAVSGTTTTTTTKKGGGGSGFFGSIRGLFTRSEVGTEESEGPAKSGSSPLKMRFGANERKWSTRTERNLKAIQRGGRDSDDEGGPSTSYTPPTISPPALTAPAPAKTTESPRRQSRKLRKSSGKTHKRSDSDTSLGGGKVDSPGVKRAEKWVGDVRKESRNVGKKEEAEEKDNLDRGWLSDGGVPVVFGVPSSSSAPAMPALSSSSTALGDTKPSGAESDSGASVARKKSKGKKLFVADVEGGALDRPSRAGVDGSSVKTVMSASAPERRASLGPGGKPASKAGSLHTNKQSPASAAKRASSVDRGTRSGLTGANGSNLLSIIEDVSRQNREGWKTWEKSIGGSSRTPVKASGSSSTAPILFEPIKAPAPVKREQIDGLSLLAASNASGKGTPSSKPDDGGPGRRATTDGLPASMSSSSLLHPSASVSSRNKMPLKSAMRNSSRSPSPAPFYGAPSGLSSAPELFSLAAKSSGKGKVGDVPNGIVLLSKPAGEHDRRPVVIGGLPQAPTALTRNDAALAPRNDGKAGDGEDDGGSDGGDSISSYETGHEVLVLDDGTERGQELPAPPPPPHDKDLTPRPMSRSFKTPRPTSKGTSDVSSSSTSTQLAAPQALLEKTNVEALGGSSNGSTPESSEVPHRRKSVRVMLQPTFSPTPPALDEYSGSHEPWDGIGGASSFGGWQSRIPDAAAAAGPSDGAEDGKWLDSSDEDEEYQRARRLLSRKTVKKHKKRV